MIRLLNRKPRCATIVQGDGKPPLAMAVKDAQELHAAGKLQLLPDVQAYRGQAYGPPRSWRQQIHNEWPMLHPDVVALCAKYSNREPTNASQS